MQVFNWCVDWSSSANRSDSPKAETTTYGWGCIYLHWYIHIERADIYLQYLYMHLERVMIINDSFYPAPTFELWEQSKLPLLRFKVSDRSTKWEPSWNVVPLSRLNSMCCAQPFGFGWQKITSTTRSAAVQAQTNPRKMQELSQELLGKPSVKLVGFYQPFEVMRIIGKKVFYSFRLVMINDETPNYSKIVEQLHHVPFWKLTYPLPTA